MNTQITGGLVGNLYTPPPPPSLPRRIEITLETLAMIHGESVTVEAV